MCLYLGELDIISLIAQHDGICLACYLIVFLLVACGSQNTYCWVTLGFRMDGWCRSVQGKDTFLNCSCS